MKKLYWKAIDKKIYYSNMIKKSIGTDIEYIDLFYMASKTLIYRAQNDFNPFLQYVHMLNILQQDKDIQNGLEIGGGYSTIVLSKLIFDNNCKITSIDINPDKYKSILPDKKYRNKLFSLINIVEDLTIDYNTMVDFYKNTLEKELSRYNADELQKHILKFTSDFKGGYVDLKTDPLEYLFKDNKLNLFDKVLTNDVLEREKGFYQMFDKVQKKGYVNTILENNIIYDFIFFDCGELSSIVEWILLEKQIKTGGYAILHDIYFPKSIKNFLVGALISISDEWEIVYKDTSSVQGMLIARKMGIK